MSTTHKHGDRSAKPLTPETWKAFDKLFGDNRGVWGGCWCMFFHEPGSFDSHKYERNRRAKRKLVNEGHAHGTIVYCGGDPVGWCQFGPKEELPRIDRKKGYVPTSDDAWRITCLFVSRGHRAKGFAKYSVDESLREMKKLGVKSVESYPVEGKLSATLLWSGTPGLFEESGFSRVGPLGKSSWIYARKLSSSKIS